MKFLSTMYHCLTARSTCGKVNFEETEHRTGTLFLQNPKWDSISGGTAIGYSLYLCVAVRSQIDPEIPIPAEWRRMDWFGRGHKHLRTNRWLMFFTLFKQKSSLRLFPRLQKFTFHCIFWLMEKVSAERFQHLIKLEASKFD